MKELQARYDRMLHDPDPLRRTVAARQLARLQRRVARPHAETDPRPPSCWAHVPLADLFEQQGNHVSALRDGSYVSGHEPLHGSKSGRCVVITPRLGYWWCRSCRQGGDAARSVMAVRGWSYVRAAHWLTEQYGEPKSRPTARTRRVLEA